MRRLVSEAFFHGRRLKDLGNGTQVATLVIVQADAATENSRLFSSQFFTLHTLTLFETSSYRRLGQRFINWAIAVVSEADRELTCSPSPTTAVAQSMKHRPNLRNLPVYALLENGKENIPTLD